jgi:lipopolysaccharide biosynthesis glycosyltransferase
MLPETYPWRMAYYKLNALEWLTEHQGKSLLLDVDAFFVSSIKDLI